MITRYAVQLVVDTEQHGNSYKLTNPKKYESYLAFSVMACELMAYDLIVTSVNTHARHTGLWFPEFLRCPHISMVTVQSNTGLVIRTCGAGFREASLSNTDVPNTLPARKHLPALHFQFDSVSYVCA